MIYNLFIIFLKIGLLSFGGGYAVIPLIEKNIIINNSWISYGEFKEMITISQLTPGPLAVNISTFVGFHVKSYMGAIITTSATLIPGLIILVFLINFFKSGTSKKINTLLETLYLFGFLLITIASINIIDIYTSNNILQFPEIIFIIFFSFLSLKLNIRTSTTLFCGALFGLIRVLICL